MPPVSNTVLTSYYQFSLVPAATQVKPTQRPQFQLKKKKKKEKKKGTGLYHFFGSAGRSGILVQNSLSQRSQSISNTEKRFKVSRAHD